jgi:hypothetical protein
MNEGREETTTDREPGEPHATPSRRPWHTPRVIVSDARDTQNASAVLDDGPQSVS